MRSIFDVVVVGAGGSGLAAALAAAEAGGSVLVLEKLSQPGGTTGIAVSSSTAAGTSLQQRAGVVDDAQAHAEDAGRFAPPAVEARNNDPLRRFFLERAAETFEWLRGHGLTFHGPSPEPQNRAPRMHNVVPGAKAYIRGARLLVTWQHPEDRLFADGAILVNADGRRFVDELRSPDREVAAAGQPGKVAYLLLGPGPWALLGPVKAYFTTTEGGARITPRLEVVGADGRPIPGLYAVGQNGLGGMVLWGHGLHIAWALTSGRLAGRKVMSGG